MSTEINLRLFSILITNLIIKHMKSLFFKFSGLLILLSVFFISCKSPQSADKQEVVEAPGIIPLPANITWGTANYQIPSNNTICYNEGSQVAARWLNQLLQGANVSSNLTPGVACGNWQVVLDPGLKSKHGEEGYVLDISENGVTLKSGTEAGLFYGVQTLRQFFPAGIEQNTVASGPILLRQAHIEDQPLYSWRGTMVDVARSFFGLEYLKRHVDRMALYKMNRLHLHLSDDQGWRLEIKSKPKLTEIGSKGSVTGGNSGFLTQEEYMELQDYALARNIIIIPEIDMPGHIYSALVSYPELNCPDNANIHPKKATPPDLYTGYDVGWSRFCLENPATYNFVADVLGEVAEITKGPWIHIGGDEIEDPLYETFVVKADSIVRGLGKTTIGWEEVTKAEVDESLISQNWHGKTESVVGNVRVIESICTNFYLDHANFPGQENTLNWCKEDGVSIKDVYAFDSVKENVIGVEAPVWTEHVLNDKMMDDRFWPRTLAVAEVGWTPEPRRDFSNFIVRLSKHGERLNQMGIHFHPSPEVEWTASKKAATPNTVFADFDPK